MKKTIVKLVSLYLFFFLNSCAYNIHSTWVNSIQYELSISKLLNQVEEKSAKNTDYKNRKTFLLKILGEEVNEQTLEAMNNKIEEFFSDYMISDKLELANETRKNFYNKNKLFIEDFLFSFRVNKDLLQIDEEIGLLIIPQVVHWACLSCQEKNLIYFRLSIVDLEKKELIWFADNYYRFSKEPSLEKLSQKINLLWQQIFARVKRDFKK